MKDRALVLLGLLLSALVLFGLFGPGETQRRSLPHSEDPGEHGLLALFRYLDEAGLDAGSLREPYTRLESHAPGRGNLLLITLPRQRELEYGEAAALADWLRSGNRALMLLHSTPPQFEGRALDHADELLVPLDRALAPDGPDHAPEAGTDGTILRPLLQHPFLQDVRSARVPALPPGAERLRFLEAEAPRLGLLRDAGGETVFWWLPVDRGGLWLAERGRLIANPWLAEGDNARLVLNLLEHALAGDGRVLFDDYHQGLTTLYDPQAFFTDSRLHLSLLFITGFWLLTVFGHGNRLAPRPLTHAPPRPADRVEASAGLYARRLDDRDVAAGMLSGFHNHVRRLHRQPVNGEPAWSLLEQHHGIDPDDLRRLRRIADQLPGRRPSLITVSQLLHRKRKQLS